MELLKKTAALRIEQQTLNIPQEDVTNISLSDVPLLPERIACFTALSHLTLVSMKPKLKTLLAIPLDTLKSLRMLDVSDNNITVSADETLPVYPTMRKLFIANNKINQWARWSDSLPLSQTSKYSMLRIIMRMIVLAVLKCLNCFQNCQYWIPCQRTVGKWRFWTRMRIAVTKKMVMMMMKASSRLLLARNVKMMEVNLTAKMMMNPLLRLCERNRPCCAPRPLDARGCL
ncbi:hypothetical protein DPX39_050018800 [Trypanosoma brucei equiperdum]|uniref:Uncharacterized protein n=1 Tax=Trypanosoma brucei equiperdum TaxID=630700 RepID=A0A3L6LB05_9TRYP|nr:hypothetical protein DPX39_050018800 [Trypanosoma brucei equiperdum]